MTPTAATSPLHPLRYYGSALLLALALFLLSAFVLWQQWEQAQASAATSLLNTAKILTHDVEHAFEQTDALLKSVGRRYLITTQLGDEAMVRLQSEAAHEVADYPLVSRITIANAEGDVVFSSAFGPDIRRRPHISDRDYFVRAKAGETGPFYAGPLQARLKGEWSLLLARRLVSSQGEFRGVVMAVLPVEEIAQSFSALDLGPAGIVALRTADLTRVVQHPVEAGEGRGIGTLTDSQTMRNLVSHHPDQGVYRAVAPNDGTDRLYAYQRFGDSPFYMTVGRTTVEFTQAWRTAAFVLGLLWLVMTGVLFWTVDRMRRSALALHRQNLTLEQRVSERTRELDALNERQRNILEGTDVGTWEWNVQTGEVIFNQRWAEMLGYRLDEFNPLSIDTWIQLTHADDLKHAQVLLETHFAGGQPYYACELRMRHRDGHWVWILDRGKVASWSADGQPLWMFGTHQDITDHKRLEQDLQSRMQELSAILDNSSVGITFVKERRQAWVNRRMIELFGYGPEEMVGMPTECFYASRDDYERVGREGYPLLSRGEHFSTECQMRHREGRLFWVRVSGKAIDPADLTHGSIWILEDIHARKLAEQQAYRYKALVESSTDAIISTTLNGLVTSWNTGAETMLGYVAAEMLGQPISPLFPPGAESEERRILARITRGETVPPLETQRRYRGGRLVDVSVTISPIVDDQGQIVGVSKIMRDIRAAKQAQAALVEAREAAEKANLAKSAFLAHMSHEIRTPMNGILGLAEVALHKAYDPELWEYLDQIHQSANSLMGILNDILDQAKIEAGELSLDPGLFDLESLLGTLRALFATAASAKSLKLTLEADPDVPRILSGDALRLQQVLSNLLSNAIKFTSHGDVRLHVGLLEEGEQSVVLRWSVEDTGIGMDSATIARLFKPFSQGDSSITRRFGGTGLGLSITWSLISLMGGRLDVTSTPGIGSRFSVDLPLQRGASPHWVAQTPSSDGTAIQGARILVAEDQPINQKVIGDMLHLLGIEYTLAQCGEEALVRLSEADYDAVLMDIQMPGMDGITATKQLRCNPAWAKLPVIALTAGVTEAEQAKIAAAGLNDLLPKPVTLEALRAMLTRWVSAT